MKNGLFLLMVAIVVSATASASESEVRNYTSRITRGELTNYFLGQIGELGSDDTSDIFTGQGLTVDVKHLAWPEGRSYPGRLDIDVKREGVSLGGTFFSINNLDDLKNISPFGVSLSIEGQEAIVNLDFRDGTEQITHFSVMDLRNEILFLDVVSNPLNFQMIRPVVLDFVTTGVLAKEFRLDANPFKVGFYAHDVDEGDVLFVSELMSTATEEPSLLKTFYTSRSLNSFRRAMFAGRYTQDGMNFKVIYYPAMGQRE